MKSGFCLNGQAAFSSVQKVPRFDWFLGALSDRGTYLKVRIGSEGKYTRQVSKHPLETLEKVHILNKGGAESGALPFDFEQIDPELQRVIDAWPTLPESLRTGILAMIDAAAK